MPMKNAKYFFAVLISMSAFTAQAAFITTAPTPDLVTTFSGSNAIFHNAGTVVVNGMSVSGTPSWWEGPANYYGFGGNGTNTDYMVATNDGSNSYSLLFNLGGLYGWAGGLFNYAPGYGKPLLEALANDGSTILESYDLSLTAPITSQGFSFRGIHRSEDDIAFLRISGAYIGSHAIMAGDAANVPEPTTIALLVSGLLGFGYTRRKATQA